MSETEQIQLQLISSFNEVKQEAWDSVANPYWHQTPQGIAPALESTHKINESNSELFQFNPFISYSFLKSLEDAACTTAHTGWLPRPLILTEGDQLLGAVPTYIKSHSQGEYVFDYAWADAFHRAGGSYYPKLQCSIPFTPVTGPRLLVSPNADRTQTQHLLTEGLKEICHRLDISSLHLTFLQEQEAQTLAQKSFLLRTDQQFHWENHNYACFDDFLTALSSRKRKTIKKERRTALERGLEVEWLTGADLQEHHWDAFYAFYMDTGSRKWGSPYLNREFFSLLSERMAGNLLLIMAKREGRYIAGALNFIGSHTLFGRNWGCIEHHPCLHFELCYYQAIDFAIQNKLMRVEAGAQGEHKLARGYVPKTTRSAHWIANPSFRNAVADYLDYERKLVEHNQEILEQHTPFRKTGD